MKDDGYYDEIGFDRKEGPIDHEGCLVVKEEL